MLPGDIYFIIISYLDYKILYRVSLVNRLFYKIVANILKKHKIAISVIERFWKKYGGFVGEKSKIQLAIRPSWELTLFVGNFLPSYRIPKEKEFFITETNGRSLHWDLKKIPICCFMEKNVEFVFKLRDRKCSFNIPNESTYIKFLQVTTNKEESVIVRFYFERYNGDKHIFMRAIGNGSVIAYLHYNVIGSLYMTPKLEIISNASIAKVLIRYIVLDSKWVNTFAIGNFEIEPLRYREGMAGRMY